MTSTSPIELSMDMISLLELFWKYTVALEANWILTNGYV